MVYCTKCGTAVEGRFCPNCGAAVSAEDAMPGATRGERAAPYPEPAAFPGTPRAGIVLPSKIASLLCYVAPFIGPLVFLFLEPYNRSSLIRFNAWQALFVQLAFAAIRIVIRVFSDMSWQLGDLLADIAGVMYVVIIVVMAVKSLQDEKYVLPLVGPLAEKQT